MTRSRPLTLLAGAAGMALIALAAVGCGGGGNGAIAATAPATTANGGAATIGTASAGDLGTILVDSQGRTLYLFEADKPNVSNCSGGCLSLWPAFTSQDKPQARGAAVESEIGTIATSDGSQQVTYNGHPLYYYAADQKAGDTTGQGLDQFGAVWEVLGASGNGIDSD